MKRKQGRPRTVDGDEVVVLRCSSAVVRKMNRLAKAWSVSRSEAIRRLVEDAESKL